MAGGLDAFLNVAIPIGIFGVLGFMIYKNFKVEIDKLIAWASAQIKGDDKSGEPYKVYNNPYLGETIVYQ